MTFEDFIKQAWNDHATQTLDVAQRLRDGIHKIENAGHIAQWAQLTTHVFGEHMGAWQEGVQLLQSQSQSKHIDEVSNFALLRSIASLEYSSGVRTSLDDFPKSDRIRILSISASALSEQSQIEKARHAFEAALTEADTGLTSEDPANRALAITGNNLAITFENKKSRSEAETEMMVFSATVGRKYWAIAGTWMEVERAEYRLAMSYLQAERLGEALSHAQACLDIVQKNGNDNIEAFFAYEAIAKVEAARENRAAVANAFRQANLAFDRMEPGDRAWCLPTLEALKLV
jgi:tetratricopeptide (TPR) repeat protein